MLFIENIAKKHKINAEKMLFMLTQFTQNSYLSFSIEKSISAALVSHTRETHV